MVMQTEEATRQSIGDVQTAEQPGTEQPQVETPFANVQGEQVVEPRTPVAEKVYTQAEVDAAKTEVMSQKDREIWQHREALAQIALGQQIAQARQEEEAVRTRDKADLDAGYITEEEVGQRRNARTYTQQLRQQAQQLGPVLEGLYADANSLGMAVNVFHIAQEVAKEDKLNHFETMELFDKMMSGERMTHPEQVKTRAASLRLQRSQEALRAVKAAPETFASGITGGVGSRADSMTPMQKVLYGLTQKR